MKDGNTQLSITWWKNKQIVVHSFSGVLFGYKKMLQHELLGAIREGLSADKVQETKDPRLHSMSGKAMVLLILLCLLMLLIKTVRAGKLLSNKVPQKKIPGGLTLGPSAYPKIPTIPLFYDHHPFLRLPLFSL